MALHRIGNYELLGELGRGGMGVVYRGVDSFIKRPVAIKTIYLSDIQDDQERKFLKERLYREAQSAGILSHPNIVTIYQIGEQDEITYIAMEFVDGPNLAQILRQREQGNVSMEFLVSVFEQTASGLDHAHSQGVIHRDIKPANIMVRNDGVAKITDFGVAKISSQTVTRTGMTLGTPHFMAPEQIQGKKLDGRADQYSLGVVMYEAITGKRPFTADSMTTLIFRIVSDPVDPQRDNPQLSDAVSEVLKRALAKHADDRFPSCEALARAFREAVGLGGSMAGASGSFAPSSALGATGTQPYRIPTSIQPVPSSGTSPSLGLSPTGSTPSAPPRPTPVPSTRTEIPKPPAPSQSPASGNALHAEWGNASGSANAQAGWTAAPAGNSSAPSPRRNVWLAPVLVVVGLAFVVGIFGVIKLLTGDEATAPPDLIEGTSIASTPTTDRGAEAEAAGAGKTTESPGGSSQPGTQNATGSTSPQTAAPRTAPPAATSSAPAAVKTASPALTPAKSPPAAADLPASRASRPAPTDSGRAETVNARPSTERSAAPSQTRPAGTDRAPAAAKPSAPAVPGATAAPVAVEEVKQAPAAPTPAVPVTAAPATPAVIVAPRPTLRVPAVYPSAARREGVGGTVGLRALVNTSGVPTNIEVVKGIRPDLDTAAKEALAKWRFQPGTTDGKPVEARVNVEITFSLVQDQRKPMSLRNP